MCFPHPPGPSPFGERMNVCERTAWRRLGKTLPNRQTTAPLRITLQFDGSKARFSWNMVMWQFVRQQMLSSSWYSLPFPHSVRNSLSAQSKIRGPCFLEFLGVRLCRLYVLAPYLWELDQVYVEVGVFQRWFIFALARCSRGCVHDQPGIPLE